MLKRDRGSAEIQGFAPRKVVAVSAGVAWTPGGNDDAFCVPSFCTYTINGAGLAASLDAGDTRVIV